MRTVSIHARLMPHFFCAAHSIEFRCKPTGRMLHRGPKRISESMRGAASSRRGLGLAETYVCPSLGVGTHAYVSTLVAKLRVVRVAERHGSVAQVPPTRALLCCVCYTDGVREAWLSC